MDEGRAGMHVHGQIRAFGGREGEQSACLRLWIPEEIVMLNVHTGVVGIAARKLRFREIEWDVLLTLRPSDERAVGAPPGIEVFSHRVVAASM